MMRIIKILLIIVTSLLLTTPALAGAPSNRDVVALPALAGTAPAAPLWSPDGRYLAFLWNDVGMPFRDLWLVAGEGSEPVRLTRLAPDYPALEENDGLSLDELKLRAARRADNGISQVVWTPDSRSLLFVHRGRIWIIGREGGEPLPLFEDVPPRGRAAYAPTGEMLAFVQHHDLWLHDPDSGSERQLTELGRPGIGRVAIGAFATPDAEVRRFQWSADGRYLAIEHIDRTAVRRVPVPSYLHDEEPILHEIRRPSPGDTGEIRRIGIIEVDSGDLNWLALGDPSRHVIHEFSWSPTRNELLVHRGSDVAEDRWIHRYSPADGELVELHHDHRSRRIYPLHRAFWSPDGDQIVFVAEDEDHYRLHVISRQGGDSRRLTGDYDVAGTRGAAWMAAIGEDIYYVAAAHSPYERHLYRRPLAGGEAERLTTRPGVHEPVVSPDGTRLASILSSDDHPAELFLGPAEADAELERITRSPPPAFYEHDWATPRYVTFPSRIDDYVLHARIVEPRELKPGHRYPVLIGNIYSDTVRNAWDAVRPTTNFQQRLALTGEYVHVQVDLRGSVGYGVSFREAFQGDWGGDDLEDLLSAVDYLATLDHVDPERIGLWGNSYGGLMILTALFKHPGVFAGGVAGAPAVDIWHFTGFDQHLTRRPDTHPDIFAEGSLLDLGEDLADPLLIIHGMHDDIVPYKTTLMMVEKLMLLKRDFELITMANAAHWWATPEHYGIYTFRRLEDFLRRHVPPGPRPAGD